MRSPERVSLAHPQKGMYLCRELMRDLDLARHQRINILLVQLKGQMF